MKCIDICKTYDTGWLDFERGGGGGGISLMHLNRFFRLSIR